MQIDNKIGVRRFGLVNWIGVATLVKREIMRFLAVWNQTIAAPMVTSGLFLLIFNIAVGPNRGLVMGYSYIIFMVPGIVMMSIIPSQAPILSIGSRVTRHQNQRLRRLHAD